MIFGYDELKECVLEDFNRFYQMGFSDKQILPAVLNEYAYGEGFCQTEHSCIYLFLVLNYMDTGLDYRELVKTLQRLMTDDVKNEIKAELGAEYAKYIADLAVINQKGTNFR